MLELQGEKIVLREFGSGHLHDPAYFGWLRDVEVVIPIYRLEYLLPIKFEHVVAYVEGLWASSRDCLFAIHDRASGAFIGTQRIGHIEWRTGTADIGVLVGDRGFWGKGVASEAVALARDYAFGPLSLRRLTGGTPESNVGMIRCFLKAGFREEGRLRQQLLVRGNYEDHVLFGLLKGEDN